MSVCCMGVVGANLAEMLCRDIVTIYWSRQAPKPLEARASLFVVGSHFGGDALLFPPNLFCSPIFFIKNGTELVFSLSVGV